MKNLIPSGLIPSAEKIAEQAALRLEEESQLSLRRVFNATGIILHTNLGRAPLGKRADGGGAGCDEWLFQSGI